MPRSESMKGQRTNTTSASGRKERSATSTSHGGSRVEPSHVLEHAREERAKTVTRKSAGKVAKKADAETTGTTKSVAKKSVATKSIAKKSVATKSVAKKSVAKKKTTRK